MYIIALTTCHNRLKKTLKALGGLHNQELPKGVKLSIIVVDDGSTDGTSDMIYETFPSIEVIKGNGSLFWAGGMRYGWQHIIATKKKFDLIFVYNDDACFFSDALSILTKNYLTIKKTNQAPCVVSGAFTSKDKKLITYGGLKRNSNWNPLKFNREKPNEKKPIPVDTLNMNGALIEKAAIRKIGFLSECYTHSKADWDYGLRLAKSGGSVWLASHPIGICDRNSPKGTSADQSLNVFKRWKLLLSIKEMPIHETKCYFQSHLGKLWPAFIAYFYLKKLSSFLIAK